MPTKPPDLEPVVLQRWTRPFDGPDWMFEPKYEGFRGFLCNLASGCEIRVRQMHHAERFADLRQRLGEVLNGRQVVLDGQVVALDGHGKPTLRDLLKGRGHLAFAAVDLVWLDGEDLRAMPLTERKRRLAALLPADTGSLYKVFTLAEHGRALFETARRMDLEGIVAKRAGDPYGPETLWYVIRNPGYKGEAIRALPERPWAARRDAAAPTPRS
jgi:bifunctional non-homologous end joining protein LigD